MSDIKKFFTSRWEDGYIVECDFSQLEVAVLAYLSQDPQLMKDLKEGVDIHSINAQHLFGKNFTDKQRKIAKSLSFQLQYGAGAKSMAESNSIDIKIAKQFIETYYSRYKEVKNWQDDIAERVKRNRSPSKKRTAANRPAGMSRIDSETGRVYTFTEYDAPDFMRDRGVDTSFSPTQMKNYPVQGLATGDIVPMIVGELLDVIKDDSSLASRALLVNTVHDSIVLDVQAEVLEEAIETTIKVMESAPKLLRKNFGIDFNMPLPAEASYGRNWGEMGDWKQ